MVMDDGCTPGSGSDNPAVAGSSGIISEAALAHAPALTERTLRELGIPLEQAIEQVNFTLFTSRSHVNLVLINHSLVRRNLIRDNTL